MKISISLCILLSMGFALVLTDSCKKDTNNNPTSTQNNGIIFNPNLTYGTLKDIDGNIYKTITIGTQTWMAENLKVTHYRNGEPIPNVTDATAWSNLTTGAYCDYNDTPASSATYGRLYNWYAVNDNRNIAPMGWHVPTDAECNVLEKYLDNTVDTTVIGWVGPDIGGKLKETGYTHWLSPNTGATNSSGFSALPGGIRDLDGTFFDITSYGNWWSSTEYSTTYAWYRFMLYGNSGVYRNLSSKHYGFSVRCLRD
jgi:uncharacterized protein (TIGR02145 family)